MNGSIPPLPQYAFTAWCSAKAQRQLYLLTKGMRENSNVASTFNITGMEK
jgi:hypothetical protein